MAIPGLDADRCRVRNRQAATRDHLEGAPVRLFRGEESLLHLGTVELTSQGKLPSTEQEALAMIHASGGRNAQGEALTADDVWIHYAEAANDNFIPDRYMFLAPSTLKNIAKDAAKGVAFMNSHRTGGLSHPSELPFGRTFAGRYEEYRDSAGDLKRRALIAFYMLKGVRPNGEGGPSTDDLHAGIEARTVFDVSVGLYGGAALCDLCGNNVDYWRGEEDEEECSHVPGTKRGMTAKELESQTKRGVTNGKCSYSLHDAGMGECSAVFDGAVPGAGFRKALSLCRHGALDAVTLADCRTAYRPLLSKRDFRAGEGLVSHPRTQAELASALATFWEDEFETEKPPEPIVPTWQYLGEHQAIVLGETRTITLTDTQISDLATGEEAHAVPSFADQLDAAHVAVAGCIARAEALTRVSTGRRVQLEALLKEGQALLCKLQPEPPSARLQDLHRRSLRLRAGLPLAE